MKSVLHDWPGSGETPSGISPYIGFREKSKDMEHKSGACCLFICLNCTPTDLIGFRSNHKCRKDTCLNWTVFKFHLISPHSIVNTIGRTYVFI